MTQGELKYRLRPWLLGAAIAAIGIAGSILLADRQTESLTKVEQARLAQAANGFTEALARRIDAYAEIAFGLRGLLIVDPELSRRSFDRAVAHLEIEQRHPGIKNVAFTRYVAAAERAQFEARVRADTSIQPEGYPNFAIHPAGERESYFVADYLWPLAGNPGIHGLDISAQPANLASMIYSRQSGQPVASAPFNLLQEKIHREGFVIRVPVFRATAAAPSNAAQTTRFLGAVAVTLRVYDLVNQLKKEGRMQGLMLNMTDMGSSLPFAAASDARPLFVSTEAAIDGASYRRDLGVYGRNWQLLFQPTTDFLSDSERRLPVSIEIAGSLISLLLASLVTLLARGRAHALQRVEITGQALQESEDRWQFALEGAGDGVWDWNLQSDEAYLSRRWKEMLGYADEEIANHPDEWRRRVHGDDYPRVMETMSSQLHRPGDTVSVEFRMIDKAGHWRWILGRGLLLSVSPDGKPLRLVGVNTDITQRKEMEIASQASESRLQDILRRLPIGVCIVDDGGEIVFRNARFVQLTGYDESETATTSAMWRLAYPDADYRHRLADDWIAAVRQASLHNTDIAPQEHHVVCKDGIVRIMEVTGILLEKSVLATFIDLTERKRAEDSLRIAATAFESQEAIVVTDANSIILRINQAFTAITGYTEAEVLGKTPRLLKSNRHDTAFYAEMWEALHRNGVWQGEIWDRRKNGEIYPEWLTISAVKNADGKVTHYVGTQTDITQRKQAEEQIKYLAFYDPLTQLPNRRLLLDRLQQALATSHRTRHYSALFFIDLDNFKTLNDTLGHDRGDLLLQQVAQRLVSCVREGDTLARLGGDEFIVMLEDVGVSPQEAATHAEVVGEKILDTLNRPYNLKGANYHSTPSIGVTLFCDHRETVDELLKRSDLAMYQAKSAGKNTLRFFDPEMQAVVSARAAMENDLRDGLRLRQFLLHYQAQVESNRMTGAEVLLRWRHPQRGFVSPGEFIPLAEETGLILPLGQWVLLTACRQLMAWESDPEMAHLTLAVNVSSRQFRQTDFVEKVLAALEETGANPQRLKLELTESLLLDSIEDTIAKMTRLKAEGVGFSLDDFGTGYSSLSYLKRLPLDQLKIDRSFVRDVMTDPNDAAIARTIVSLAHSLGLSVIAEGVETEAQRDFLVAHGCHSFQGYLYSRPGPVENLRLVAL